MIPGADAFQLFDTYGFPLEDTIRLSKEKGNGVDIPGFYAAAKRAGWKPKKALTLIREQTAFVFGDEFAKNCAWMLARGEQEGRW